MKSRLLIYLFLALLSTSCSKDLNMVVVENTPESNFNFFWGEFDKYYPYFELKKVNWDSIYNMYSPMISPSTTDKQLYDILKKVSLNLKDGHVNVFTSLGTIQYTGWYDKYPSNKLDRKVFLKNYIINPLTHDVFDYGYTKNNIGYIAINSFDGDSNIFGYIDSILNKLSNAKALIIDVRNNSGGFNTNSAIVSGRFATESKLAYKTRYRNSSDRNSFTQWQVYNNKPLTPKPYTKKVAILTNRGCFSATEDFLMLMRSVQNCKFIGDTTGGGSGNPVFRQMPNGWYFRLSTWQSIDAEGNFCEGRGIYPDIPMNIKPKDSKAGIDTIMETALTFLQSE